MTTVSVVIPTYNRAPTIGDAVESVLSQLGPDDEVLVVDDGSTDDTAAALVSFPAAVRLIRQENAGPSAARNRGVANAVNEWVAFLDSDDLWLPGRLDALRRDAAQHAFGVHVCDARFTGDGYDQRFFAVIDVKAPSSAANLLPTPFDLAVACPQLGSVAVRRDLFETVGLFDETMNFAEDLHLLCRLSLAAPWAVSGDLAVEVRRVASGEEGLVERARRKAVAAAEMKLKVYDDLSAVPIADPALAHKIAAKRSGAMFELSEAQHRAGLYLAAKASLLRSAARHPSIKGWAKALPPLGLGGPGYRMVKAGKSGFRRTDFSEA